jgi:hypothetical protein
MQEQEHTRNVENKRWTTRMPETAIEEMFNAIRECRSNVASSEDTEDREDKDDDEEVSQHGKLSEDDEPGWVIERISKTVQQHMKSFAQKQMRLDELTQPEWGGTANYFRVSDMKSRTTELQVLAVGKPQTNITAATPSLETFGELRQSRYMVPGLSEMPQATSRQGGIQMKLG